MNSTSAAEDDGNSKLHGNDSPRAAGDGAGESGKRGGGDLDATRIGGDTLPASSPGSTADPANAAHDDIHSGSLSTKSEAADDSWSPSRPASVPTPTGPAAPRAEAPSNAQQDDKDAGSSDYSGLTVTRILSPSISDDPDARIVGAPLSDLEDHFDTLVEEKELAAAMSKGAGFVIGDYLIMGELGRGGMGVVYKARHRKLNRVVALKMILAGKHTGADALTRFIVEARAVAHLQHPGIVQIFDIGEHAGMPYFSLEFVEGKDLLRDLNGQPRDAKTSAALVEQLAIAMQYAHDNGILHRDLKPANVLLDAAGKAKITDFGLAKQVDADASTATSDGTIMGSPSYMPPEQARGDMSSVTPRSDLYSLGAILYQMLTGRPPFLSDRPLETVMQVINNDAVPPRQLSPALPVDIETICVKALQKEQANRYASCKELAEDLRRFINGEPILARPVSRLERVWRWCRRNPKVAIPSTLAALFITATALIATWAWSATSAQAVIIAQERDTAKNERDEAKRQKDIADEQRGFAIASEEKARKEQAEAERQRILANEAQLQAETNQKNAEKQAMLALTSMQLIVTDIDNKLAAQPGTADVRIALMQILEKKWDELDLAMVGGIKGEAIPTLMVVRLKIANAWVSLDRIAEADAQYKKIFDSAEQRLIDKNRNDATRFNLAFICRDWADIKARLSGNPADATELRDRALELLREIQRDPRPEPGSPQQFQISDVLQKTLIGSASAYLKVGQLTKADAAYAEAAQVSEAVLRDVDAHAEWFTTLKPETQSLVKSYFMQNLEISRAGRASNLCRLGKVDEAVEIYEGIVQRLRDASRKSPEDANGRDQLARQLGNYGQYMLRVGRIDDAARLLAESHQLVETNYDSDPTNAAYKRSYGYSLYYLGVARDLQGLSTDSLVLFERSRVVREELHAVSADKNNKVDLMLSEARLGNVDAAKALTDELSASENKDPDLRLDVARALAQLARRTEGDAQTAFRKASLDALDRCLEDGQTDPFAIATQQDLAPVRDDDRFLAIVAKLEDSERQNIPR